MATDLTDVLQNALRLRAVDRAKLIDALYSSLESDELRARDQAWVREAKSRLDAYDAGKIDSEPWDDLKERFRRQA